MATRRVVLSAVPRVSVIVPVYNSECDLVQCLETILAQTFEDIEVICVDDGSTDRSGDILADFAARDSRVVIIEQCNQGVSAARNRGLDEASGDYIQFLDADDFFEPDLIEKMYSGCVADDADIGICPFRYFNEDTGRTIDASWSLYRDLLPDRMPFNVTDMTGRIFRFVAPGVWNKTMRRSFIVEHGLRFSTELSRAEDLPFTYLALISARRITIVDEHLVNYRKHSRGSLQETTHEAPLEICKSLELFRSQLIDSGLFEILERDFVNAALHQCLFTVATIRTPEAFGELYEALKDRYFAALGLLDHPRAYFYSESDYDMCMNIMRLGPSEFLLEELLRAQAALGHVRERCDRTSAQALDSSARLRRIRRSRSFRLGRRIAALLGGARQLGPREGGRADARA